MVGTRRRFQEISAFELRAIDAFHKRKSQYPHVNSSDYLLCLMFGVKNTCGSYIIIITISGAG